MSNRRNVHENVLPWLPNRFVLFILIIITFNIKAEPTVNVEHIFYSVIASSEEDILEALRNSTPIETNGKKYHGYTDYHIQWNYKYEKNDRSCRIKNVNTTLDLTYTLPKLSDNYASAKLKKIWSLWLPKLTSHEYGHRELAVNSAREIESSIRMLPSSRSCKALGKEANLIGYGLLDKLKLVTKEYDKNTQHGKKQGGWLVTYLKR